MIQRFSDRIGLTHLPNEIQVDSMSTELRNSLWNLLLINLDEYDYWYRTSKYLMINYYRENLLEFSGVKDHCIQWLYNKFFKALWYDVYNIIEFIQQNIEVTTERGILQYDFEKQLNLILERELAGYRSINFVIVSISNPQEVAEIKSAIQFSNTFGLSGVSQHISNALSLISKKPDADYRNSIKESISAVEGICKILTGEKSGGVDKALTKLTTKVQVHQALKNGFSNLYGYASDEDGIRHPILEMTEIGFAEAKYMLVSCSAFVNYLIDKSRQSGLLDVNNQT